MRLIKNYITEMKDMGHTLNLNVVFNIKFPFWRIPCNQTHNEDTKNDLASSVTYYLSPNLTTTDLGESYGRNYECEPSAPFTFIGHRWPVKADRVPLHGAVISIWNISVATKGILWIYICGDNNKGTVLQQFH